MRALAIRLSAVAVLFALVAPVGPVAAGTGGRWEKFTGGNLGNTDAPVLHRTGDGRLHILWPEHSAGRILHRSVSPTGALGATSTVVSGWSNVSIPGVVAEGGGMRAFFSGQRSTNSDDPYQYMSTATAPATGSTWALGPNQVVESDIPGDIAATLAPDGAPLQTWAASTGVFVHRGLEPGTNNSIAAGCCSYNPDLAVEGSSGRMWVGWYTVTQSRTGVYVHEINPATGAPIGTASRMPGSSTVYQGNQISVNMGARTPIVGRPGRAGVFTAYPGGYPSTDKLVVWRLGRDSSTVVGRGNGVDNAALTVDPQGRVWVLWTQRTNSGPRIFARRSNPAVTAWGRPVSVRSPSDVVDGYRLAANAQSRRVDVVAIFGKVNETASWHTQLKPALTLTAQPRRFSGRRTVTFTVRDAGVPVPKALVKVAGKSERTNSNGVARIVVGPYSTTKRVPAVATKTGFVRHRIVLRVRPG
jgi:hypothetical protein